MVADERGRTSGVPVLKLCTLELQHPSKLLCIKVLDERLELAQGKAKLLEGDDAVQPSDLRCVVAPVSGRRVNRRRREEPHGLVVVEGSNRHACQTSVCPCGVIAISRSGGEIKIT